MTVNAEIPAHFSDGVERALNDPTIQQKLKFILRQLRAARRATIPAGTPADANRERGRLIRSEVILHLDDYLSEFIKKARGNGIQVHVASTAADAREIVREIARASGVRRVAKGKSMVSEECEIREALEHDGITVTETDLGELLCQLDGQRPSHLIAPAIHMDLPKMTQVLQVCADEGQTLPPDAKALMAASRKWLRRRMFEAEMGITGANFGIAETGGFFIVTNEGNGRMSSTLPRIHVAMMGIERLLPDLASVPTILQLLTRCGTGQRVTTYVSFFTGPRRAGEIHGPEQQHLVLVDNGRSEMLGGEFTEALNCIRCGACLNHCPVYEKSGGHSYRSTYAGPIGAVITPFLGRSAIENELPHASSLCGACREACPVKIDIPNLLIRLRTRMRYSGRMEGIEPAAVGLGSRVLASPFLYKMAARVGRFGLRRFAREGWILKAPGPGSGWTLNRDLPAPSPESFRDLWRRRREKN
jgi:L-lactate dehydrogenase complex protein LldF